MTVQDIAAVGWWLCVLIFWVLAVSGAVIFLIAVLVGGVRAIRSWGKPKA